MIDTAVAEKAQCNVYDRSCAGEGVCNACSLPVAMPRWHVRKVMLSRGEVSLNEPTFELHPACPFAIDLA